MKRDLVERFIGDPDGVNLDGNEIQPEGGKAEEAKNEDYKKMEDEEEKEAK